MNKQVHILPREMFGASTFGIAMKLLRWLPIKLVDWLLLLAARMVLGDTERHGLRRPKLGPLEIKNVTGKSPVLDVGAWSFIKSGNIKVRAFAVKKTIKSRRVHEGVFSTRFRRSCQR